MNSVNVHGTCVCQRQPQQQQRHLCPFQWTSFLLWNCLHTYVVGISPYAYVSLCVWICLFLHYVQLRVRTFRVERVKISNIRHCFVKIQYDVDDGDDNCEEEEEAAVFAAIALIVVKKWCNLNLSTSCVCVFFFFFISYSICMWRIHTIYSNSLTKNTHLLFISIPFNLFNSNRQLECERNCKY